VIRLLLLLARLGFYRWAAREIDPMHPDVDRVVVTCNELEHEWRCAIVNVRRWRATSPTLSAVKTWL
jgi:hypothetical protein